MTKLDDKYRLDFGQIYLSGIQALVRLPIIQAKHDRARGLKTAGFISGYRGSPLGGYDKELWKAKKFLQENNIHFQPGLNEDLAATSVWGTQQVNLKPNSKVDGVFSIFYGKGPGIDRSMDVLKHANSAGTSKHGGVLAVVGDDHGCVSSTLLHQSEQVLQAAMIPVLNPASIEEYIDYGLYGFALSRFSGCWVAFKAVSQTVESSASIYANPYSFQYVLPELLTGDLNIRWPDSPAEQENRLINFKMKAIHDFSMINSIDEFVFNPRSARLGIITTGKAYLDVMQALQELGLTDKKMSPNLMYNLGIAVYKVGLTWPLNADRIKRFAGGLDEILVIEEKRSFIEEQIANILFNSPNKPKLFGKFDENHNVLVPSTGELDICNVAEAIASRLKKYEIPVIDQNLIRLQHYYPINLLSENQRTPFYCSGCPHNTSTTKLPEGSRAMAGIGCHYLAMNIDQKTETFTHMGGEGANWIGQAPFSNDKHIFQNLGDGTYQHSGLLAIRAAAVAGVNITYKILFNSAVAMTGGQEVDGHPTVQQIIREVLAEGAKKIVVVTDDVSKYAWLDLPVDVKVYDRSKLDEVQKELRNIPGLTILLYDQECAAEKRRKRKRGIYQEPQKRVFINEAVCEGCNDCSVQSNCISIEPVETEFGRKRKINQSSCNKDFSCVNGFCPSFVTVLGGNLKKNKPDQFAFEIPIPNILNVDHYSILITGIGGTGITTLGGILGMAAHLEGKGITCLDFTGLAQKNGAVMSHIKITRHSNHLISEQSVKIQSGEANLTLGCDINVAISSTALNAIEKAKTVAIVNSNYAPTADFVKNGNIDFQIKNMQRIIKEAVDKIDFINASEISSKLFGETTTANILMLGFAFQKGLIPLKLESILEAIRLNNTSVKENTEAFNYGRLAAYDLSKLKEIIHIDEEKPKETLNQLIERRYNFLVEYQNKEYADKYKTFVKMVIDKDKDVGKELTNNVAKYLFKLMAIKDEYEVGRLYTDGEFTKKLNDQFSGNFKLKFSLAPPLFSKKKRDYGTLMWYGFKILAKLKGLRGGWFDIFGYTVERKLERGLIEDYRELIEEILISLKDENYKIAVQLASLPEKIKGYGHVKMKNIAETKKLEEKLLASFNHKSA